MDPRGLQERIQETSQKNQKEKKGKVLQKLLGRYNISDKYGYQWIAPERTGSRKVAEILSFFGFTNEGRPIHSANKYAYTHQVIFDEGVENYKLICNARNPYSKTLAVFRNLLRGDYRNASKDEFKKYLFGVLKDGWSLGMIQNPLLTKKIDYIIRLEHMSEDLKKIPFVLEKFTPSQVDMLSYHPKPIFNWEEFYDQETKELVYSHTSHLFEMWGYEK